MGMLVNDTKRVQFCTSIHRRQHKACVHGLMLLSPLSHPENLPKPQIPEPAVLGFGPTQPIYGCRNNPSCSESESHFPDPFVLVLGRNRVVLLEEIVFGPNRSLVFSPICHSCLEPFGASGFA